MKAWQLTGVDEPLRLIEREDPSAGPGEVVIDVKAAGLCHSDIGFMDGTLTALLPGLPMILGHEVAGTVSEIGAGVEGLAIGQRVVLSGVERSAPGWSIDGGYATKCRTIAEGVLPLADAISYVQGATATDAGMTSYGAVMLSGELKAGQKVGIVGLGGLGMTGARIAVLNGAEVYGAEPNREAWGKAEALGVKEVVEDVRELARYGLDLIVDFAGFGTTTAGAIEAVRPGGLVVQVGLGRTEATIPSGTLVHKAVTLRGSRGGMAGALEGVLGHMAKGELEIAASTVGFEEIPDALERLRKGGVVGRLVATL